MVLFKRLLGLAAIAAVVLSLTACERKITRVEVTQAANTCFQCHSDTSAVLVAAQGQWENSQHATGSTLNENDSSCKGCHTSQGFIYRITGVTAPNEIENATAIGCFTCHAPHSNGDFRLRVNLPVTLANAVSYDLGAGNLCATCHQSRRSVATYLTTRTALSNRFGPHHGPQGDMLIGTNGYEFAGYTYEKSNHRGAVPDGCIGCHKKGGIGYAVGGHSFKMEGELAGSTVLNVAGTCASEACHGAGVTTFNVGGIQDTVTTLIADLKTRLVTAGLMDAATVLPKSVTTSKDSAGAVYNLMLALEDRSNGVHNPKYIKGLLRSSIQFISAPPPGLRAIAKN